jgi:hypothetical protein
MKYLLIPACNDLEFGTTAELWLPALRKPQPLHGVLGYVDRYNGGSDGALVMMRFATFLHDRNPRKTILEAWREANAGRPWGAILHASAVQDKMITWVSPEGLTTPPSGGPVLHFDSKHFPEGRQVHGQPDDYEGFFVMEDGTPITAENREETTVGLFPGRRGAILLRKNAGGNFGKNQTMLVLFARFRLSRTEMDLDKLLKFDGDWPIGNPRRDPRLNIHQNGNRFKETKPAKTFTRDAIEYALPDNGKEVRIPYTVKSDAKTNYPDDGGAGRSMFYLFLFPPGANRNERAQGLSMSGHGPYLHDPR